MRSTHSCLTLLSSDKPIAYQEHVTPRLDSVNLHASRFYDIDNLNDGCIVSRSAADKLEAYKVTVHNFEVPSNATIEWKIEVSKDPEMDLKNLYFKKILAPPDEGKSYLFHALFRKESISKNFPDIIAAVARMESSSNHIVRPHQIVAKVTYSLGTNDEAIPNDRVIYHRTKMKLPWGAVVTSIEQHPSNNPGTTVWTILYKSIVPAQVGDKLMNQTGHKYTIAKILPDEEMPTVDGKKLQLIVPFEVGKRCTPASIIEEMASLVWEKTKDQNLVYSLCAGNCVEEIHKKLNTWLTENNCSYIQDIEWKGQTISVPHGYIRIYRCDKIPGEILKYTTKQAGQKKFNPSRDGRKMTYTLLLSMFTRKAFTLFKWMVSLGTKDAKRNFMYETIMNSLTAEIDPESLVKIWKYIPSGVEFDRFFIADKSERYQREYASSVLDVNIAYGEKYGYIETYNLNGEPSHIVMPPGFARIFVTDAKSYIMNALARHLNNIVGYTQVYERTKAEANLQRIAHEKSRYLELLTDILEGLIGEYNSPDIGSYVYSVASSDSSLEYNQVGIPEKAFKDFCRKNRAFAENPMGLVIRQPVHDECEFVSMKVVPRETNTISIHPVMISLFRGDFDGDPLTVVIPDDAAAYRDMDKMSIENVLDKQDLWNLKSIVEKLSDSDEDIPKWQREFITFTHPDAIGLTSTFDNMEYENTTKWDNFIKTQWTRELLDKNSIEAAWNMGAIKTETALAGGISLAFIGWLIFRSGYYSPHLIQYGLQFYRFVAENALDNKHAGGNLSRELLDLYNSCRLNDQGEPQLPARAEVELLLRDLVQSAGSNPDNYSSFYDLVKKFFEYKAEFATNREFLNSISPVYTMIRNQADTDTLIKYVKMQVGYSMFGELLKNVGERA